MLIFLATQVARLIRLVKVILRGQPPMSIFWLKTSLNPGRNERPRYLGFPLQLHKIDLNFIHQHKKLPSSKHTMELLT